jgi:hypothetical protein
MWINALRASSGRLTIAAMLLMGFLNSSLAGPPYRTDDPEPTDYGHYEIYAFTNGIVAEDGTSGASGIDFNYGGHQIFSSPQRSPWDIPFPMEAPSWVG